jgi:hypothetical protein
MQRHFRQQLNQCLNFQHPFLQLALLAPDYKVRAKLHQQLRQQTSSVILEHPKI